MAIKCQRCMSEDVSGGILHCDSCGNEWEPSADADNNITGLVNAARDVVACWASGDLAAAVRRLNAALGEFPAE